MENEKRLLSKEQASCILKISTRTLDRRVKSGVVIPIQVGKNVRFSKDTLTKNKPRRGGKC